MRSTLVLGLLVVAAVAFVSGSALVEKEQELRDGLARDERSVVDRNSIQAIQDLENSFKDGFLTPLRVKRNAIYRSVLRVLRWLIRFARRTHITRSGRRVTFHYLKRGNYQTALKDFRFFRPGNIKSFRSGNISGYTGTIWRVRITVRNGSSGPVSQPTLEIRLGNFVYKFRYAAQ